MRGVVTVAAAETIPAGTPHRDSVVLAAFFVALITLVLFGLTLPGLIARMGFETESPEDQRDAVRSLLRRVGTSAIDALGPLDQQRVDGEPVSPAVVTTMREDVLPRLVAGAQGPRQAPDARDQMVVLQRRYLDAMRDALLSERGIGAYSSATYRSVELTLDRLEQRFG
jgi:monovalent cation/hydrogen antiporter